MGLGWMIINEMNHEARARQREANRALGLRGDASRRTYKAAYEAKHGHQWTNAECVMLLIFSPVILVLLIVVGISRLITALGAGESTGDNQARRDAEKVRLNTRNLAREGRKAQKESIRSYRKAYRSWE